MSGSYWRQWLAGTALAAIAAPAVHAQVPREHDIQIPAQELDRSIGQVAQSTGRSIIAPAQLVAGRPAPALAGRYSPEEALRLLLAGSGLEIAAVGDALVIRAGSAASTSDEAEPVAAAADPAIVVTGTRIRGAGPTGSDVVTVNRTDLDRGGFATVEQVLRSVPQVYGGGPSEATSGVSVRGDATLNVFFGSGVNLRGLGTSSTLVLLNGRRPPLGGYSGAFADLSLIPLTAIERIEVLADGASAIYGSDAVAGVVNVIARTRFDGIEAVARIGTGDGDFGEVQLGGTLGTEWGGGSLLLSYEYYRRGRLEAADRPYASDDLRPFGGADYRLTYAVPGTIMAGGRSFAIPAGQDGRDLDPADLISDAVNLGNAWEGADLLPRQERHSSFLRAEQELAADIMLYVEGLYAARRFELSPRPLSLIPRFVTPDNPFYVDPIGTGEPILVFYDFRRDLGQERQRGKVEAVGITGGVSATAGAWALDLHGTFGRQDEDFVADNLVNSAKLAIALADPDPATAFNLFGQGTSNNPATIEFIRGSTSLFGRYRTWSAAAKADGPLFRLPGGSARLAVGGELREETYLGISIGNRSQVEPIRTEDAFPDRRILAGYGEIHLPLIAPENGVTAIRGLAVSAAARFEDYSDFGSTLNPKLGATWTVVDGLRLRASYGRSFRAPAFRDLQQGPQNRFYFVFPLADPAAPDGVTNSLVLRGNDPDIGPERATTWTVGVDLSPVRVPGLRASLTWFNVDYRDRILDLSSELFSFYARPEIYAPLIDRSPDPDEIAGYFADPSFVDLFGIPASSVEALIDSRTQNLSRLKQAGLDFELGYARPLLGGTIDLSVSGSWIAHIRQTVTEGSPAVDLVGTLGNPADLRLRAGASWSDEQTTFAVLANHIAGYENRVAVPAEPVSSWTTLDLHAGIELPGPSGRGTFGLALNVSNLFDQDPPYVENFNGLVATGYDPENASPLGRMISVQAKVRW